jgi:hypothetical protein
MFKKKIAMLILMGGMLVTAAGFNACGRLSSDKQEADDIRPDITTVATEQQASYDLQKSTEESYAGEKDEAVSKSAAAPNAPQDKTAATEKIPSKVIKTADISVQVESLERSRTAMLKMILKHNAVLSSENQVNDGYRMVNTMVIRVDAPRFDSLVDELMTEAIYIEHKTVNSDDVTEEYVDLDARLKSKKEVEAQYTQILKQARTINEILEVTEYLRTIREEIESVEGRMKYINDRAAYSTINLTYYEQLDNVSSKPDRSFSSRMGEALGWGWSGLLDFFLGIIYLWPLWLITGLLAWFITFLIKRKIRRRRTAKEKSSK